ncbi:hypothetical protein G9C98_006615 [Cotesia typhae]|uniref:Ku70/Ku80 N-terminal alpha/beta domain-containing protein n=1 Tax=Cotesia typhae TaxID=2053667 RepID=A0A8J5R4F8_9HYME|nr:hypothetical protein G9C98_006615 [Cotesia typhae]
MPRKSSKETVVFVTNVGVNVDGKYDVNFLENAKIAMERVIEKKIFVRPKDEVGVILMGVEDGNNSLELNLIDNYINVQLPSFDMIEKIREIKPQDIEFKNWISGLQAALKMISDQVEGSNRITIILITNCYPTNPFESPDLQHLWNTLSSRAFDPEASIPEPKLSVLKPIQPPEWKNSNELANCITDIISAYEIKDEPKKTFEPVDIIDVSQLTQQPTIKKNTEPGDFLPRPMDVDLDALFTD